MIRPAPAARGQVAEIAAICVGLLLVWLLAGAWLSGWRAQTLTTPSMGRTAPVGSLVISARTRAADIRVGDVLAVHPPGRPNTTFVHRVADITTGPSGLVFHTKGDINGSSDPWTVTSAEIVGRVEIAVPDVGYLLNMLPLLLLASLLTLLLTHGLRRPVRTPARILLACLLFSAALIYYQPLTRIDLIAQSTAGTSGQAAVVTTGMLPLRVDAVGGTRADLTPGQVGTLSTHHDSRGVFHINAHPHLSGWWWLLTLTWAIPLIAAARSRREDHRSHRDLRANDLVLLAGCAENRR